MDISPKNSEDLRSGRLLGRAEFDLNAALALCQVLGDDCAQCEYGSCD